MTASEIRGMDFNMCIKEIVHPKMTSRCISFFCRTETWAAKLKRCIDSACVLWTLCICRSKTHQLEYRRVLKPQRPDSRHFCTIFPLLHPHWDLSHREWHNSLQTNEKIILIFTNLTQSHFKTLFKHSCHLSLVKKIQRNKRKQKAPPPISRHWLFNQINKW